MLINDNLFIEVDACQRIASGKSLSGDVYLQKRFDNCIISLLFCGGNSASIKGNISATILASMALEHFKKNKSIIEVSESIISTIKLTAEYPKATSSTFTIVKIDNQANVDILCYGTPNPICLRGDKMIELDEIQNEFSSIYEHKSSYKTYNFIAKTEDRIVFFNNLLIAKDNKDNKINNQHFWSSTTGLITNFINETGDISASNLVRKIILESYNYDDGYKVFGDQSCGVVYFRHPRKALLCTGPPFDERKDKYLSEKVRDHIGNVIICGGSTAGIISRELNRKITVKMGHDPSGLPNESSMDGVNMITEGVLTMNRVKITLDSINDNDLKGRGIDIKLTKKLLEHDVIEMIVGTRINAMHHDPNIPIELELRKNVVKEIARLLRDKFFKEVKIEYL